MSKALFVGDPHAVLEELKDCQALADLVVESCQKHDISNLVLLGDQHHNHAVVRVEVTAFYRNFLSRCHDDYGIDVLMLRGNHDMPNAGGEQGDALLAYDDMPGVKVVRDADWWPPLPGVLFAGYQGNPTAFVDLIAQQEPAPTGGGTLVCHQTFSGATFENGFKCPDGIDPNLIPQSLILSGHIHTAQKFGKVWYMGAPRWRTLSDANVERALYILEFDDAGNLVSETPIDTGAVCKRILSYEDTATNPIDMSIFIVTNKPQKKDQIRVLIRGPSDFVAKRLPLWEELGARPQIVKTDRNKPTREIKESEGIAQAFNKYLGGFAAPNATPRAQLEQMVQARLRL